MDAFQVWVFMVAVSVLCGWWLSIRSGASFRAIANPVSFLIITLALLLCTLAVRESGVGGGPRVAQARPAAPQALAPHALP